MRGLFSLSLASRKIRHESEGCGSLWAVIIRLCCVEVIFSRLSKPIQPLRGLARSHRYCTCVRPDALSVGAGKPAKRPGQAVTGSLAFVLCANKV